MSTIYASTTYGRIATVNVFFAAKKIAIDLNRKASGCTTRRRGKPLVIEMMQLCTRNMNASEYYCLASRAAGLAGTTSPFLLEGCSILLRHIHCKVWCDLG